MAVGFAASRVSPPLSLGSAEPEQPATRPVIIMDAAIAATRFRENVIALLNLFFEMVMPRGRQLPVPGVSGYLKIAGCGKRSRNHRVNALKPVTARPTMRVLISRVPS